MALDRPVGESHLYSNANYIVLGLLVQTASGQSYEAYLQEHILQPLGMQQTFTSKEDADPLGWRAATATGSACPYRPTCRTPAASCPPPTSITTALLGAAIIMQLLALTRAWGP